MDEGLSVESTNGSSEVLQPETDFAEFYCGVISKLYDLKCRQIAVDVKKALLHMRRLKFQTDNIQERTYFSYKKPPVRCAYMYAYSVLHTLMVYSEFSSVLKRNKRFLFPVFNRDSLAMCCLGGGPGTEAVAICKSINDFFFETTPESDVSTMEVSVTMIDKIPHWKREETAVINAANDSSNLLHSKRIILRTDFMKADLLKPFENSLREKIKAADIVTIIKLGGSIQERNPIDSNLMLQNMMENVINSMEEGSLLFVLNNAGGGVFHSAINVLRKNEYPFFLRKSMHKEYRLDRKTVKKLRDLVQDTHYRSVLPTEMGKISSCLWIKNVDPPVTVKKHASSKKLKTASIGNNRSSVTKTEEIDKKLKATSIENTQSSVEKTDEKLKKRKKKKLKAASIKNTRSSMAETEKFE